MAAGLSNLPFEQIFLVIGSGIASFSYGLVVQDWRGRAIEPGRTGLPSLAQPSAAPGQTPSSPVQVPSGEGGIEKPKGPPLKKPSITLPNVVKAHLVPIALVVIGLPLTVVGLILAGLNPSVALGYGIFIPGILLFGIGGLLLFLQLNRKPVGARRFCMHCGFPMMTTDFECSRCHRQPPSGIDTKACPNCGAVIPALAKFCKDCGAGQPTT
jgi:Double zinc ribbon